MFFLIINSIFFCRFILSFVRRYSDIFQALQTQKGHREYEMFRIHGTRWVQAVSHLHRTVSRKVLFVNREVNEIFFVVPLVPCTTTSPALGLTKYANAYEIRHARGKARRGGIGEMRDLNFFFFLSLADECLSFLCLLCLESIFTRARTLSASYYSWDNLFQTFRLWMMTWNPPLAAPSLLLFVHSTPSQSLEKAVSEDSEGPLVFYWIC